MAETSTRIDDALTNIQKRDWPRLVRGAAEGQRFELIDGDLERPVMLQALEPAPELVTSVTVDGHPRGAWVHGRPAAALRGRLVSLLWRHVIDAEDEDEDDLTAATALAMHSPTPTVPVEDLTAREGRRLLAETARLDVGRWAVAVTHPYGPAHVVIAAEVVWEVAAPVRIIDGDRVVGGGLYTHQQLETLLEVGHAAWVAEQAGQPWTTSKTVAALAAAARAAGTPRPLPA